jgi:hypothetical protein
VRDLASLDRSENPTNYVRDRLGTTHAAAVRDWQGSPKGYGTL